ncbi:MAG: hypothetical protein IPQ00_03040 [Chloracidobacterium sp.]|nr:hypothetical protein [Chloracidobacterium sp.]
MHDNMAQGWQEVFQLSIESLDLTKSGKKLPEVANNQFWAEHQRCFRNLITVFKVPTLIHEIVRMPLGRKESIVVSITGTGESQTKKQIERAADQEAVLPTASISVREKLLLDSVSNCFRPRVSPRKEPIQQKGTIEYIPL